ncbi:MAG: ABC transporter substrate-binding protein [Actinomycetota bacterium]
MPTEDQELRLPTDSRVSRRRFLGGGAAGLAALGLGPLLAACGDSDGDSSSATTAAGASATTAAAAAGSGDIPSIKIGVVTPRTGPLAPFGETDAFVLDQMRAELGDAVEIVDVDAESDSARAAEVAQELILNDGVNLVLVGGTPDMTVPVVAQCDLNEIPCISTVAPWQPHYLGTGGELGPDVTPGVASVWNHHFFWGLEDIIQVFIELWEQSGAAKVVGALWPNDPDGNAWGDPNVGFPPALEAAGFTVVDPGRFELSTTDFTAQINAFRDAGVEIVTGVVPPPVFGNVQAQMLQQGFNPPVVTVGKALLFSSAVATFPQPEGLSSEIWWTDRHPFASSLTGQSAAELAGAFTEATDNTWEQPLGFVHAMFEIAIDAAKLAGSADAGPLNDAIGATNLSTVVGTIDFASGPVPGVAKTPLTAGQWGAGADDGFELAVNINSQLPDLPTDGTITPIS